MKVLVIPPGEKPHDQDPFLKHVNNETAFGDVGADIIKGWIEVHHLLLPTKKWPYAAALQMMVDSEGWLKGLKPNPLATAIYKKFSGKIGPAEFVGIAVFASGPNVDKMSDIDVEQMKVIHTVKKGWWIDD